MHRFLFWGGGTMLLVILLIVFAAQLFPKQAACEDFYNSYVPAHAPEQTTMMTSPDWFINADCQGVQNDLYLAYYFMAIGVALVGTGFVIRR